MSSSKEACPADAVLKSPDMVTDEALLAIVLQNPNQAQLTDATKKLRGIMTTLKDGCTF